MSDADMTEAQATSSKSGALKRGSACITCRKKKMRCDGVRPTCQNCEKNHLECGWGIKKPVSRVAMLEKKIGKAIQTLLERRETDSRTILVSEADLESLLNNDSRNAYSSSSSAASTFPYPSNSSFCIDAPVPMNPTEPPTVPRNIYNEALLDFSPSEATRSALSSDKDAHQYSLTSFEFMLGFQGADGSDGASQQFQASASQPEPSMMNMPDFSDPTYMPFESVIQMPQDPLSSAFSISSNGFTSYTNDSWKNDTTPAPATVPALEIFNRAAIFNSTPDFSAEPVSKSNPNNAIPALSSGSSSSPSQQSQQQGTPQEDTTSNSHSPEEQPSVFIPELSFPWSLDSSAKTPWEIQDVELKKTLLKQSEDFELFVKIRRETVDRTVDDHAAVPPVLRDHLKRQLGGQNIHIPKLLASVRRPKEEQPFDGLLYAIYTTSCRLSPVEQVRNLESSFLKLSKVKIHEAALKMERLLQVIQASLVLCLYFTSLGQYPLGWLYSATCMRLASCAGLNRISSTVVIPPHPDEVYRDQGPMKLKNIATLKHLRRKRVVLIPPAIENIELWERLATFWTIYLVDRNASSVTSWCEATPDTHIETPFLRPLNEYEENTIMEEDYQSLRELFTTTTVSPQLKEDNLWILNVKAMAILHRCSRLSDPFFNPSQQGDRGIFVSRKPPVELVEMRKCINNFIASLPAQYSDATRDVPGGIPSIASGVHQPQLAWDEQPSTDAVLGKDPGVILLHTLIYVTLQIILEDEAEYDETLLGGSVKAARGVVGLIKGIEDIDFGQLDMHFPPLWKMTARTLLRECQRKEAEGDFEGSALLQVEVEVIIMSLKRFGAQFMIGSSQEQIVKLLKGLTVNEPVRRA